MYMYMYLFAISLAIKMRIYTSIVVIIGFCSIVMHNCQCT